jgi:hypothetical protein
MQVGDLVRWKPRRPVDLNREVGIVVAFETNYNRFGEPVDRSIIINWCNNGLTEEIIYADELEVVG